MLNIQENIELDSGTEVGSPSKLLQSDVDHCRLYQR